MSHECPKGVLLLSSEVVRVNVYRIIDNLYGKKRMSMFNTLLNYLKAKNHALDVSGSILNAVQLDYHEALHTIMEVYSKIHVDNRIGEYTLLQWSILCGSMGCVVYLRDRHATFVSRIASP